MIGHVAVESLVALPRAVVWEGLRDLTRAQFYVPNVARIEMSTEQREGVGASRRVSVKSGKDVDETVISWKPGESVRLRVHEGDKPTRPFADAWAEYELFERGPAETLVRCTFCYRLEWGPFSRIADLLLFRPAIGRSLRTMARALKQHYETGAVANPAYDGHMPANAPRLAEQ